MKVHLLFAAAWLLVSAGIVDARLVRFLSYQDLVSHCDLVVIATPTAAADTKEQIDLPGISMVDPDGTSSGLPVVGVETKFHVSAVLKGDGSLKDFVLHHYREAHPLDELVADGNALVTFDVSKPGSFLLFLVHEPDGRYAPFDQVDPKLLSVQKLQTNTQEPTGE